ncbi:MAG: hypothetical protein KDC05_13285 [Bacteroidales bacterium]|nr:hypothetical protein [Bacteroidales bacterium]
MRVNIYNSIDTVSTLEKKEIIDFLHQNLTGYQDNWSEIQNAVEYALNPNPAFGGFILYVRKEGKIAGTLVMTKTRMKGFMPENHLVYMASGQENDHEDIENHLLQHALKMSKGNISLHVHDNDPMIKTFEKAGFEIKYLEMRYAGK